MHSDFSQAFNFDEAVLHDVDPRTGAYPVIFSFEDIVSHDFYGARFTLKLKNDPLDMTNYGFGRTWAPMLTRYDKKNGKLFTSDGRQYDFDGTNLLRHYDVNNFLIRKNEAEKTIDIIYRSGVTERCGTENDVNYMTTLFSPEGKKLRFLYSPLSSENETIYRLEKVMDESVPRSLEIRYLTENEVLIIYRRKDYIYQAYQCRIWNGQLYFVSLPNVTEFGTSISYQNINNGLYISKLTMSTGYTETISYDAGHKLPPGNPLGLDRLPRVTKVVHGNGIHQEDTIREFSYSEDANYLGLYGDKPWDGTYGDNTYTAPSTYGYFSVETINSRRSIKRTYNKFHTLVETMETGDKEPLSLTQYEYNGNVADPVDKQPRNFLLPKKETTFSYEPDNAASSETTRTYSYDEEGNLLEFSDGHMRLSNEYLSSEIDPLGFKRLLSISTKEDILGLGGMVKEWYAYQQHDYLSGSGLPGAFPYLSRKVSSTNITQEYDYEWDDERLFGHAREIITMGRGLTMSTETRSFEFNEEEKTFTEHLEIKGAMGPETRRSVTTSLLNNLERERRELDGQTISFTYDYLSRVSTVVTSLNDEASTTKIITYNFEGQEKQVSISMASKDVTDTLGYNNRGNLVSVRRNNQLLEENEYDAYSRLISKKTYDYTADGNAISATYAYDYDLKGRHTATRYVEAGSFLEQKGYDDTERSSWSRVPGMAYKKQYRDSLGNIIKTEHYSAKNVLLRSEEYEYDGFSRMIKHTIGNLMKQYSYDVFGRVTDFHTSEGGALGSCDYPNFTDKPLTRELSIDGLLFASREFDSLGRIHSEKLVNTRGTTYTYDGAARLPSTVTGLGGKQTYTNNNHLDRPLLMVSEPSSGSAQTESRTYFSYNEEGRVTNATNQNLALYFAYNGAGFLERQLIHDLNTGHIFSASATYSPHGNMLTRRDYLDLDTHYTYNGLGLLTKIESGSTTVTFAYDDVRRPTSRIVRQGGGAPAIECKYLYDEDMGLISGKETYIGDAKAHYEKYNYDNNGMIRRLERAFNNESPMVEEYAYDAQGRMISHSREKDGVKTSESYVFDRMNNISEMESVLPDGSRITTTYVLHDDIPCQIQKITDTQGKTIQVEVNEDGGIINMDGLAFTYDSMGRLAEIRNENEDFGCSYFCDPFGTLHLQKGENDSFCRFLFFGEELFNCAASDGKASYISDGDEIFLEIRRKEEVTAERYLITDYKGSVIAEIEGDAVTLRRSFTPYGEDGDIVPKTGVTGLPAIGFNNEPRDSAFHLYHLGKGYRTYNPKIMRFLTADNLSPFDGGGINPFIYCVGNPVNLTDGTGHLSGMAVAAVAVGALGLLLSLFTFGAGMAVAINMAGAVIVAGSFSAAGVSATAVTTTALSVASSALGITSSSLSIASSVVAERGYEGDAKLSAALAWGATGTGLAGLVTGIGAFVGASLLSRATAAITPRVIPNMYPPRTQLGGISVGSGDIVGHGFRFGVLARFGGYTSVNGAQLAKLTANYTTPYASIRLGTCFGGYGGRISVAQLLANATGKEVHAASGYYTMFSAIRDLDRTYRPLTGIARQVSDITGKAVSGIVRTSLDGRSVLFRAPLQVAQQGFATKHEV